MKLQQFELQGEYIELVALLKVLKLANSGGQAKLMVEDGLVHLNNIRESRKRAKLRKGDKVKIGQLTIEIV